MTVFLTHNLCAPISWGGEWQFKSIKSVPICGYYLGYRGWALCKKNKKLCLPCREERPYQGDLCGSNNKKEDIWV